MLQSLKGVITFDLDRCVLYKGTANSNIRRWLTKRVGPTRTMPATTKQNSRVKQNMHTRTSTAAGESNTNKTSWPTARYLASIRRLPVNSTPAVAEQTSTSISCSAPAAVSPLLTHHPTHPHTHTPTLSAHTLSVPAVVTVPAKEQPTPRPSCFHSSGGRKEPALSLLPYPHPPPFTPLL